jgi:TolB protein
LTPTPTLFGGSAQIVFQSVPDPQQKGFSIVYAMNTDRSNLHQVLRDFIPAGEPVWSPGGTLLALTSRYNQNSSRQIYTVNADGSNLQQISTLNGENFAPAWSPDGRRIAFVNSLEMGSDIFLMNIDGTGIQNLTRTDGTGSFNYPAWSPDGTRIAYQSRQASIITPTFTQTPTVTQTVSSRNWDIFVMNSDGSNPTRLTSPQRGSDSSVQPAWSPDGRQIVFASDRNGAADIFTMNADGSNVTALTRDDFVDLMPAWSPDGRLIAFSSDRAGVFQIYVIGVDGSGLTVWTQMPGDTVDVNWLP